MLQQPACPKDDTDSKILVTPCGMMHTCNGALYAAELPAHVLQLHRAQHTICGLPLQPCHRHGWTVAEPHRKLGDGTCTACFLIASGVISDL